MAQNTPSETGSNAAGVSRRSVVRGAAWAAPAIAVAAAVPSVSASPLNDPCSPTTTNSLTSWGVNSAWPMSNNPNCGQHADVVFIFEPGIACDATQLEIVLGPLPGSNNTSDRGAIWIWDTTSTAGHRAPYGYLLDTNAPARVEGNIAIPAGGITVPKYRSSPPATDGWRDAHTDNTVNDGIHVAIYNDANGCQKVASWTFDWYWRETEPVLGAWWHMRSVLLIGATAADISLGAPQIVSGGAAVPGYTPIGYSIGA